ncbi:MAG: hypothetical protein ACO3A8_01420 [Steroidobacteraceae bacterium]
MTCTTGKGLRARTASSQRAVRASAACRLMQYACTDNSCTT